MTKSGKSAWIFWIILLAICYFVSMVFFSLDRRKGTKYRPNDERSSYYYDETNKALRVVNDKGDIGIILLDGGVQPVSWCSIGSGVNVFAADITYNDKTSESEINMNIENFLFSGERKYTKNDKLIIRVGFSADNAYFRGKKLVLTRYDKEDFDFSILDSEIRACIEKFGLLPG